MFDYFQTRREGDYGLPGIFFVNVVQYDFPPGRRSGTSTRRCCSSRSSATRSANLVRAGVRRTRLVDPPMRAASAERFSPREPLRRRSSTASSLSPTLLRYDDAWDEILNVQAPRHLPVFQGAFVDWDNSGADTATAPPSHRRRDAREVRPLHASVCSTRSPPATENERFIFINAWNEWSSAIQPDERHGLAYLDALKQARSAG